MTGSARLSSVLCMIACLFSTVANGQDVELALRHELEKARKAGIPTTPRELMPPLPPPDQNAASLYSEWGAMRKAKRITSDDDVELAKLLDPSQSDAQVKRGMETARKKQFAFDLIHLELVK